MTEKGDSVEKSVAKLPTQLNTFDSIAVGHSDAII